MKSVSPSAHLMRRNARRLTLWTSLLLVAVSIPFITHGQRQADAEQTMATAARTTNAGGKRAEFVPGNVLVRFRTDAAAKTAERNVATLQVADGAQVETRIEQFAGSTLVKGLRLAHVAPDATLQAIAALNARPDVLYAEPDYLRHIERLPNEAEFTNIWSLKNVGQFIRVNYRSPGLCDTAPATPCTFASGTAGADIKAEQSWDITTGSRNIVVGVIDEGVDINHPDLAANIWTNPGEVPGNNFDDDGNGYVDDVHGWDFTAQPNGATCTTASAAGCGNNTVFDGDVNPAIYPDDETDAHGTHVAGTIGATGDNGIGSVGINWQTTILPMKFISGSSGASSNSIRAVAYAKALRDKYVATGGAQGANVRVLNNSYGGGGFAQSEQDAIAALADSQILFVAAAGNDSANNDATPSYPANYNAPNLISVAATTRNDVLDLNYTNYGARTVHIAAPGSLILSTTPNNTYDFYYGTSMATPHVAGVAALALAANPNLSVTQLRAILLYNGDANASAAGKIYSRRRLNAYQTLLAANENDTTAPAAVGGLRVATQSGRTVSLAWTAPGDDGNTGRAALYELNFVDPGTNTRIFLGTRLPQPAGTSESANVTLPYRHVNGLVSIKVIDNVGNESALASVNVTLDPVAGDPYVPAESASAPLTTGGTPLNLHADDSYTGYTFPAGFSFPFYGQTYTTATLSTNGIMYFGSTPTGNDAGSSVAGLDNLIAIAGLWDDLRTDRRTGDDVYVVQPDSDHLIFRWQGVTFNTPLGAGVARGEHPVNFEIELRRDGTSVLRYGGTNTNLFPVVGISGGVPDSYSIASHTSETALVNLTNAPTVSFVPRPAASCTYTLAQASASVPSAGGSFSVGVTTQAGCALTTAQVTSNASWLTVSSATVSGAGAGTVSYTVAANTATVARTGLITIAGQTFTVTQAAGAPVCTYTLTPTNSNAAAGGGTFSVGVTTQSGCALTASQVTSNASWLTVSSATVDGAGAGTVSYTVAPNSAGVTRSGALSIAGQTFTVTQAAGAPVASTIQFSAANYVVGEGDGQATITVTRANDIGSTTMVTYRTEDNDTFTVNCTAAQGTAFGRCDFAMTVDTLTFAPGETQKTFVVPLINDAHVEGNETFQVSLSNPTGAALGTQTTATVTITDNDVAGAQNPIFQTPFFVRQQYLDFLAREPEAGEPWSRVLNNCADVNTGPAVPSGCDRITVSGAFFGSPEFKDKGVYVIVFYRLAFSRLPTYAEFAVDLRSVTGTTAAETFAKRAAFATAFTQRAEFGAAYGALSDTAYVAALLNNLTAITTPDPQNPDGTTKVTLTQNDLIVQLGNRALTRAQVLRAVVQSDQLSASAESTNAFVAAQYYGYLRRTPDTGGFNGWVNYLATHPGDFRTMVNGFMNSTEYRLRFGAQ